MSSDNNGNSLPQQPQQNESVVQQTEAMRTSIHDIAGKIKSSSSGNASSDDEQLEMITDKLISDADGEGELPHDTSGDGGGTSASPITTYDDLFQSPSKEGKSLFEEPPKETFDFGDLKAKWKDKFDGDAENNNSNNPATDEKDLVMRKQATEEVVFTEEESPFPQSKSVQFKNLPQNPPELLAGNNPEPKDEGEMDVEVAEEVESGVFVTEEIEEYEEINEDDEVEEVDEQMDEYSESAESGPIPDIVHQKEEIEESPEYDPSLEYDESDDEDDSDDDEDEEEDDDVEETEHDIEDRVARPTLSSLEASEGDKNSKSDAVGATAITAMAADTGVDEQSEILSLPSEDEGQNGSMENATNQTASEQHPESGEPPGVAVLSADPNSEDKQDPETPSLYFSKNSTRDSIKQERRKMLPLVIGISLAFIVGVIVVLILLSQEDREEKNLTVVPISAVNTASPTGFLRTAAPNVDSTPIGPPSELPPIFTPVEPPTLGPTSPPGLPNETPVLPPNNSPTVPTPTNPAPIPVPAPISTSNPTDILVTSTPTISVPTLPPQLPAEPQENDDCVNAIGPLPADGSLIDGDLRAATPDEVDRCGGVTTRGPGVWYYVIGTGGEMIAHTCFNGVSDTKVSVFKGSCLKPECIDANDDFCGLQSAVSWQSTYRQVYRILVHGPETPFYFGSFSLAIDVRVNDECETAAGPLTIGPGPLVEGSTLEANPNSIECDGEVNISPSLWYLIRGSGADITVSACEGSDFDVRISILVGSCNSLSCIARSEAGECSITFASTIFVEYYLMIHGSNADDVGDFSLEVTTTAIQDNDSCEDASGPLPLDSGSFFAIGSTVGATAEPNAPFCDLFPTAPGVWYYVVGTGNVAQVSLCNGASFDTRLSVYQGTCAGNDYSGLSCVRGNDDFCSQQSLVTWQSEVGVTYHILVHGYLLASGDFTLEVKELVD